MPIKVLSRRMKIANSQKPDSRMEMPLHLIQTFHSKCLPTTSARTKTKPFCSRRWAIGIPLAVSMWLSPQLLAQNAGRDESRAAVVTTPHHKWPVRFAIGVGHTVGYCDHSVTGAAQCAFAIGGSALDMYAGHQDAKAGYRELNVLHPNYTMPPLTLLHIYSISHSGPKGSWISTGFAGVHYWAGWHDLRILPR